MASELTSIECTISAVSRNHFSGPHLGGGGQIGSWVWSCKSEDNEVMVEGPAAISSHTFDPWSDPRSRGTIGMH